MIITEFLKSSPCGQRGRLMCWCGTKLGSDRCTDWSAVIPGRKKLPILPPPRHHVTGGTIPSSFSIVFSLSHLKDDQTPLKYCKKGWKYKYQCRCFSESVMENSPGTHVLGRKHRNFAAYFMEEGKQNSQVHARQIAVTYYLKKKKSHAFFSFAGFWGGRDNFLVFCRLPGRKGNCFSHMLSTVPVSFSNLGFRSLPSQYVTY